MIKTKTSSALFILLSFLFISCSDLSPFNNKSTLASPDLNDSFSVISNTPLVLNNSTPPTEEEDHLTSEDTPFVDHENQFTLVLQKAALEKEFLLSASAIPQNGAPTSQGLSGRIIVFKKIQNSVFVMEATHGHVITTDLPAQLLLTELPILNETENNITVDFNAGMNKVFTYSNWYASDFSNKNYSTNENAQGAEVNHSFIQSIQLKSTVLEIRQIAQLKTHTPLTGGVHFPTFEIRYFIKPYLPNNEFQSKETHNFHKVGYFEIAPFYEKNTGRSIVNISRWDEKKTIPFYYSANTPAEYQEAVKEGILYWNKAFGKELITAQKAPEGVTAPDPEHNIVQWVPFDQAGFAYADALMDPRTGEILHGQAYLTSAFSFGSKIRARRLLRLLEESEDKENKKDSLHISFLGSSKLCSFHPQNTLKTLIQSALDADLSDEILLRLSQDYVRQVTAHEVGHILGLRHNFAGNLDSNLQPKERNEVFNAYLTSKTIPAIKDKYTTNSVMEYLGYTDDVISGAQIKADTEAFSYDTMAIQWGYFQKPLPKDSPIFCTDSGKGKDKFLDCDTFDSGKDPITHYLDVFHHSLSNLPMNLIERMISLKAPSNPDLARPIEELALDPKREAFSLINASYGKILPWFHSAERTLKSERSFLFNSSLNEDELKKVKWKNLLDQIKNIGSFENILFILNPTLKPSDIKKPKGVELFTSTNLKEDLLIKLKEFLEKQSVKNFIGHDGKAYSWNEQELEYIESIAPHYFEVYINSLYEAMLDKLSNSKFDLEFVATQSIEEDSLTSKLESTLHKVSSHFLLKQSDTETLSGTVKLGEFEPTLLVKSYSYNHNTRVKAAAILKQGIGPVKDWSAQNRKKLKSTFTSQLNSQLGRTFTEVKPEELSRSLRQWFFEQKELLDLL